MALLASMVTFLLALPLLHERVAVYLAYVLNALDLDSALQLARFTTYWRALRWICVLASILAEFCVLPWPIDGDRLRTFLLAWSFDLAIVVLCERFTSRGSSRTRGSDPEDSPPGAQDQDFATGSSVEPDEARGNTSLEKPTDAVDLEDPYTSLVGFVLALAREWFADGTLAKLLRRFSDAYLPPAMMALLVRVSDWIPVTHKAGEDGARAGFHHYLHALDRANELVRRWPCFADTHALVARANNLVSAPLLFPACIILVLAMGVSVRVIPDPRPLNGALVAVGLCGLSGVLCVWVVRGRFAGCFESGRGRGNCEEEEKGRDVDAGGVDAVPLHGAQDEDEDNRAVHGGSGRAPQPSVGELSAPSDSVLAPIIPELPLPNSNSSRGPAEDDAVPLQRAQDEDTLAVNGVQSGKAPQPSVGELSAPSVLATTIAGLPSLPKPNSSSSSSRGSPSLNSRRPPEVVDPTHDERRAKKPRLQPREFDVFNPPHLHDFGVHVFNGNNALRKRKQQRVLRFADVGQLRGRGRELVLTPFTNRELQAVPRPALERTLVSAEWSVPPSPRLAPHSIDATEGVHRNAEKSLAAGSDSSAEPFRDVLNTPPPRMVEFAPIGLGDLHRSSPAPSGFSLRDSEKLPMTETSRWAAVGQPDVLVLGAAGEQDPEQSLQHNKNKAHLAMGAGVDHGPGGGRNAKDRKGKGKGKAPAGERKGGRGGERSWLVQTRMSEVRDLDHDVEDASSESSSASSGDTGDSEW